MKQISYNRRNSIADNRKVPLNSIILPPLSPQTPENELVGALMVNKTKTGALTSEVVLAKLTEPSKNEDHSSKSPEQVRMEHNVKFLQEQHQLMLAGLHAEIDKLKARNRELQFQLVFGKAPVSSSSPSPSSPEEDAKHKLYTSPKPVMNTTPLQIEILEKELGELKVQLQESENRNVYLSAIVDEQKKKLERYDRRREKEREHRANVQTDEVELLRKLEDAEALIRRLRRENSDLRRENTQSGADAAAAAAPVAHPQTSGHFPEQHGHQNQQHYPRDTNGYQPSRGQGHRGGGSGRAHRSGNGHNGHYNRGGWFPPLHSQNFWQGGRQHNDRSHTNGGQENGGNLPNIPVTDGGSGSQQPHHQQYHGHGRKGSNNNHYHNGDGRKYRGGHNKSNNKPS